jgi:hypothetical protein
LLQFLTFGALGLGAIALLIAGSILRQALRDASGPRYRAALVIAFMVFALGSSGTAAYMEIQERELDARQNAMMHALSAENAQLKARAATNAQAARAAAGHLQYALSIVTSNRCSGGGSGVLCPHDAKAAAGINGALGGLVAIN